MSKDIPALYVQPSFGDFIAFRPILASTWQALLSMPNRLYADQGFDTPGLSSSGSTPLFETASATYTQANSGSGPGLDTWSPMLRAMRYLTPSTAAVKLTFKAFMQNLRVRLTVYNLDTDAVVDTITLEVGSTPAWEEDDLNLDLTDVAAGDPIPLILYLEALSVASGGGTGYLWAFHPHEKLLRPGNESLLPTGS